MRKHADASEIAQTRVQVPVPIRNFIKRVHESIPTDAAQSTAGRQEGHRYEVPCILVFDEIHWRSRETELQQFRNEMEKSGRPIATLIVTNTSDGLSVLAGPAFRKLAAVTHNINHDEALALDVT